MAIKRPYNEKTIIYGEITPDIEVIDPSINDNLTYVDPITSLGNFFEKYNWDSWEIDEEADYVFFTSSPIVAEEGNEVSWSRVIVNHNCNNNIAINSTYGSSLGYSPVESETLDFSIIQPNVTSDMESASSKKYCRYLWLTVRVNKDDVEELNIYGIQHSYWLGVNTVFGHEIFEQSMEELDPELNIGDINQIGFEYMGARLPYRIMFPKDYDSEDGKTYPLIISLGGDGSQGLDAEYKAMFRYPATLLGCKLHYSHKHKDKYKCISIVIQSPRTSRSSTPTHPQHLKGLPSPYSNSGIENNSLEDRPGRRAPMISEHGRFSITDSYFAENQWGAVALIKLIESLIDNEDINIDTDRIHFTGFSRGAVDLWSILLQGRHLFASATELDGQMLFYGGGSLVFKPVLTEGEYEGIGNNYLTSEIIDIIRHISRRLKHIPIFMSWSPNHKALWTYKEFGDLALFEGFQDPLYLPQAYDRETLEVINEFEGPPYKEYPSKTLIANIMHEEGGYCEMLGPYNSHTGTISFINSESGLDKIFACSKSDRISPNPELVNRPLAVYEDDPYPSGFYTDVYQHGNFKDFNFLHHDFTKTANNFTKFILIGVGAEAVIKVNNNDYIVSIDDNDNFIWDKNGINEYYFTHKYSKKHTYLHYPYETEVDYEVKKFNDYNVIWFGSTVKGCHLFAVDTTKNNQSHYIFSHKEPQKPERKDIWINPFYNIEVNIKNDHISNRLNGDCTFRGRASSWFTYFFIIDSPLFQNYNIIDYDEEYLPYPNTDVKKIEDFSNINFSIWYSVLMFNKKFETEMLNSSKYVLNFDQNSSKIILNRYKITKNSFIHGTGIYSDINMMPANYSPFYDGEAIETYEFNIPQEYVYEIYEDIDGYNKINLSFHYICKQGIRLISNDKKITLTIKPKYDLTVPLGVNYTTIDGTSSHIGKDSSSIIFDLKKTRIHFDWEDDSTKEELILLKNDFYKLTCDTDNKMIWDADNDPYIFSGEPGEKISRLTSDGKRFFVKYLQQGSHIFELIFSDFDTFYMSVEDLITFSRLKDLEILHIYDEILNSINQSSLSDNKGNKTWITDFYLQGKENSRIDSENFYIKLVNFVKKLQQIIVDNYGTVDNYYDSNYITVSSIFADISEEAGFVISPEYIEGIS